MASVKRTLQNLLASGVDVRTLATATGMKLEDVLALHPGVKGSPTTQLTDEDIQQRTRAFAAEVIERARHMLLYGGPAQQAALVRALLVPMMNARKVEANPDEDMGELREQFGQLMAKVREPSELQPTTGTALHSDEASPDNAVPPELGTAPSAG